MAKKSPTGDHVPKHSQANARVRVYICLCIKHWQDPAVLTVPPRGTITAVLLTRKTPRL